MSKQLRNAVLFDVPLVVGVLNFRLEAVLRNGGRLRQGVLVTSSVLI
jgi:hypothetical protein